IPGCPQAVFFRKKAFPYPHTIFRFKKSVLFFSIPILPPHSLHFLHHFLFSSYYLFRLNFSLFPILHILAVVHPHSRSLPFFHFSFPSIFISSSFLSHLLSHLYDS